MSNPRCSVYIAVSADGYIARVDGSVDWLQIVEIPGEDYGYARFFDSVDALVMGRKTYETALGFEGWPYRGKRCIVLTHGTRSSRHGEQFFQGSVDALVDQLAKENVRHVYVDGGEVIRQFLSAGLISDLTLSVVPILLGDGIPLFKGAGPERALVLEESRSWASGLTQLRYHVK